MIDRAQFPKRGGAPGDVLPPGKLTSFPRLAKMMDPKSLPFEGKRMIFGGFKSVVDL